jgi:hypothetical protein
MARFFFTLASKEETIRDTKGRELTDLASAHRHAMLLIHNMTTLDHVDWRGWSINVTDANQQSVLTVLVPQSYCSKFGGLGRARDRDIAEA